MPFVRLGAGSDVVGACGVKCPEETARQATWRRKRDERDALEGVFFFVTFSGAPRERSCFPHHRSSPPLQLPD